MAPHTARRLELAAGGAAVLLAALGLALLLFAPLLPVCTSVQAASCPASAVRYVSLLHARVSPEAWAYLGILLAGGVAGGAGAMLDARGHTLAVALLWGGALLALGLSALAATGIGLVFLPAVLALCLATYASLLARRMAPGAAPEPPAPAG